MSTPDKLTYQFHPVTAGALTIDFKGPSNCHIALAPHKLEQKPICEMIIGGWNNTASVIRLDTDKSNEVAKVESKNVVTKDRFVTFYIYWNKKGLTIRMNGPGGAIFMQAIDCIKFPVHFFAVRTAWGATGSWKIRQGAQIMGKGKEVLGTAILLSTLLLIIDDVSQQLAAHSTLTKLFLTDNICMQRLISSSGHLFTKLLLKFLSDRY